MMGCDMRNPPSYQRGVISLEIPACISSGIVIPAVGTLITVIGILWRELSKERAAHIKTLEEAARDQRGRADQLRQVISATKGRGDA